MEKLQHCSAGWLLGGVDTGVGQPGWSLGGHCWSAHQFSPTAQAREWAGSPMPTPSVDGAMVWWLGPARQDTLTSSPDGSQSVDVSMATECQHRPHAVVGPQTQWHCGLRCQHRFLMSGWSLPLLPPTVFHPAWHGFFFLFFNLTFSFKCTVLVSTPGLPGTHFINQADLNSQRSD